MNEKLTQSEVAVRLALLNKTVASLNILALQGEDVYFTMMSEEILSLPPLMSDIASFLRLSPRPFLISQVYRIRFSPEVLDYFASSRGPELRSLGDAVRQAEGSLEELKRDLAAYREDPASLKSLLPDSLQATEAVELLERAVAAGFLDGSYRLRKGTTWAEANIIAGAMIKMLSLGRGGWATFGRLWYGRDIRLSTAYIPKRHVYKINLAKSLYPEVYGRSWRFKV